MKSNKLRYIVTIFKKQRQVAFMAFFFLFTFEILFLSVYAHHVSMTYSLYHQKCGMSVFTLESESQ